MLHSLHFYHIITSLYLSYSNIYAIINIKDHRHLGDVSPSAMSRIFKRLRLHGIIERVQGTYKYFATAYGKEIIAAGLTVKNLVLIPALA